MWELNHKEGWEPKNWCFQTVVLEKTLETALDSKEIKPINAKGNISWIFIGGTEAEAEALILWPSDAKSQLNGKEPDAGKDWEQEEKRAKDDEIVGWHHRLNGHEFEQTAGDRKGQGSLSCCSAWDRKQLAAAEWLITRNDQLNPDFPVPDIRHLATLPVVDSWTNQLQEKGKDSEGKITNGILFSKPKTTETLGEESFSRNLWITTDTWLNQKLPFFTSRFLDIIYEQLRKEEKLKAKEKRKDIPIWMQSSKK